MSRAPCTEHFVNSQNTILKQIIVKGFANNEGGLTDDIAKSIASELRTSVSINCSDAIFQMLQDHLEIEEQDVHYVDYLECVLMHLISLDCFPTGDNFKALLKQEMDPLLVMDKTDLLDRCINKACQTPELKDYLICLYNENYADYSAEFIIQVRKALDNDDEQYIARMTIVQLGKALHYCGRIPELSDLPVCDIIQAKLQDMLQNPCIKNYEANSTNTNILHVLVDIGDDDLINLALVNMPIEAEPALEMKINGQCTPLVYALKQGERSVAEKFSNKQLELKPKYDYLNQLAILASETDGVSCSIAALTCLQELATVFNLDTDASYYKKCQNQLMGHLSGYFIYAVSCLIHENSGCMLNKYADLATHEKLENLLTLTPSAIFDILNDVANRDDVECKWFYNICCCYYRDEDQNNEFIRSKSSYMNFFIKNAFDRYAECFINFCIDYHVIDLAECDNWYKKINGDLMPLTKKILAPFALKSRFRRVWSLWQRYKYRLEVRRNASSLSIQRAFKFYIDRVRVDSIRKKLSGSIRKIRVDSYLLQHKLNQANNLYAMAKAELSRMEEKYSAVKNDYKKIANQFDELKMQLQMHSKKAHTLSKSLSKSYAVVTKLREKVANLNKSLQEKNSTISKLQLDASAHDATVIRLRCEVAELKKILAENKLSMSRLQRDASSHDAAVEQLRTEVATLKQTSEQKDAIISRLQKKALAQDTAAKKSSAELDRLRTTLEQKKLLISELQKRLSDQNDEQKGHQSDIEASSNDVARVTIPSDELTSMMRYNENLKQHNTCLSHEIHRLRTQLAQMSHSVQQFVGRLVRTLPRPVQRAMPMQRIFSHKIPAMPDYIIGKPLPKLPHDRSKYHTVVCCRVVVDRDKGIRVQICGGETRDQHYIFTRYCQAFSVQQLSTPQLCHGVHNMAMFIPNHDALTPDYNNIELRVIDPMLNMWVVVAKVKASETIYLHKKTLNPNTEAAEKPSSITLT